MLLPGHEPGDRAPAPGRLRVVQLFVNTYNQELPGDRIGSAEGLAEFCAEHELAAGGGAAPGDVGRAIELREALRLLLMANNGHPPDADAAAVVEHAARAAQLGLRLAADGTAELVPQAPGMDGALGAIVAIAYAAMSDGSWLRLKACRRDVCQWAFYDHSRNRSGAWCAMAICGNRTKTRGYRRRQAS
jgi:predicted RNA-binding Zn ribbon-like protein